jgi:hypothetical protein
MGLYWLKSAGDYSSFSSAVVAGIHLPCSAMQSICPTSLSLLGTFQKAYLHIRLISVVLHVPLWMRAYLSLCYHQLKKPSSQSEAGLGAKPGSPAVDPGSWRARSSSGSWQAKP